MLGTLSLVNLFCDRQVDPIFQKFSGFCCCFGIQYHLRAFIAFLFNAIFFDAMMGILNFVSRFIGYHPFFPADIQGSHCEAFSQDVIRT